MHGRNSYELDDAGVDLPHLRQAVGFADATSSDLLRLAEELGQPHPDRILSLADLANRMASLRLDPARHPIETDRRRGLLLDSVGACRRRDNVSLPMKGLFVAWFAAMAIAPRRLARRSPSCSCFPRGGVG